MKILFIVSLFCFMVLPISAQTRTWDYPIKVGSAEWKKIIDHNEMLRVCQIPNETLTILKSDELVKICLDYPLIIDCFAYNSIKQGVEKVINRFNGMKELICRKDAAFIIFTELYNRSMIDQDHLSGDFERGKYDALNSVLCYILSQKDVISSSTPETNKKIISFSFMQMNLNEQNHLVSDSFAYLLCSYLDSTNINVSQSKILSDFQISGIVGNNRELIYNELGRLYSLTIK